MAYSNTNLLERIIDVQEAYLKHKQTGMTTASIYRNVIEPQFFISKSTLYNYLRTPAKKLLKQKESK